MGKVETKITLRLSGNKSNMKLNSKSNHKATEFVYWYCFSLGVCQLFGV